jgi:hypothetical protein
MRCCVTLVIGPYSGPSFGRQKTGILVVSPISGSDARFAFRSRIVQWLDRAQIRPLRYRLGARLASRHEQVGDFLRHAGAQCRDRWLGGTAAAARVGPKRADGTRPAGSSRHRSAECGRAVEPAGTAGRGYLLYQGAG